LADDCIKQRSHQFIGWHPHLLQRVDIRFREYTALPCHGMELDSIVAHVAEVLGWYPELGVDLVNDSAGPARTLVVHGRDFLLLSGFRVFFEDDDFCVLTAELDDRTRFGVQLFDGQRDRVHFLNELCPYPGRDSAAARSGNEDPDLLRRDWKCFLYPLQKL